MDATECCQQCDVQRGVCVDGANGALYCQACDDQTPCAGGMSCRGVYRDSPRNRCLSSCQRAEDCIGGTRCNNGFCEPVNYIGGWARPRQSSSCEAVLNMGSACQESSECDRIADNNWTAGHCGGEGSARGMCTKVCRLGATYNPPECPSGWSCERVPSWNNRWIGQCEPQ